MRPATSGRRRLILAYGLAVLLPGAALAILSVRHVASGDVLLRQGASDALAAQAEGFVTEVHSRLAAACAGAEADLAAAGLPDEEQALDALEARHGVMAASFEMAPDGEILAPRPPGPYDPRRAAAGDATDSQAWLDARPESEEALRATLRLFAPRMQLEAELLAARRLEVEEADPLSAAAAYDRVSHNVIDADYAALALVGLGRCMRTLGDLEGAASADRRTIALTRGRGTSPREIHPAIPAGLSLARTLEAMGRSTEAVGALLDLYSQTLDGDYGLSQGTYEQLARVLRASLDRLLAGTDAVLGDLRGRREALRGVEARRTARLALTDSEVLRRVRLLARDPGRMPMGFRTVWTQGPAPAVVRIGLRLPHGGSILGYLVDLDFVARGLVAPLAQDWAVDRQVVLVLRDSTGETLTSAGLEGGPRPLPPGTPEATRRMEPDLPFWTVTLTPADPWALTRQREQRALLLAGMVALSMAAITLGGALTLRGISRELELARMKGDFVAAVSHELKTPLTSMRMYAEMLALDRVPDEEGRRRYHGLIASECQRLSRMVENVLDFARLEEGADRFQMVPGDLEPEVRRAVESFQGQASSQGFRLLLRVEGQIPPCRFDRHSVRRVVSNLLDNAVKYSGEARDVEVLLAPADGGVALEVADHGVGIPLAEQAQIFRRFYRVREGGASQASEATEWPHGSGLGLALVEDAVHAHGGEVGVRSAPGEGSTFRVWLPAWTRRSR
ncbi:MAG: HAMP domain-containing histidine kinase [Planctomycetes bacterium]|nr:HAMP domain-containing histidine kinase [Planctomycetota bacterium]